MIRAGALSLLSLSGLAACAPIPVEQAERACLASARDATGPRTQMGVGVGSHGVRGGFISVGVSSDAIMGRDPAQVFQSCVQRRSGQMPTRPLYDQPGWRAR